MDVPPAKPRFPLMDSMRAVAATAVVGFHVATTYGLADAPGIMRQLTGRLNVGVWIFFVISGFLLYRPFVAARFACEPTPSLAGYAWRRALRIFPAYWVALTITVAWLQYPHVFTAADAPRHYLLIQSYWASSALQGLGQAWSLCVELAFYVSLGLLVAVLGRSRGRTSLSFELAIVALLAVGSVVFRWQAIVGGSEVANRLLPWYLDAFAAGMALAVLSAYYATRPRHPAWMRAIERFPSLPWIVAAAAYYVVATRIGLTGDYRQPPTEAQTLGMTTLYAAIGCCVVMPAVWGDPRQGLLRRTLGLKPIRFLGKVSYGIFLWQALVLVELLRWGLTSIVVPHLSYAIWFAAVLGASTVLATLSWYLVESPTLRLKRLVSDRVKVREPLPPVVERIAAE